MTFLLFLLSIDNKNLDLRGFVVYGQQKSGFEGFCGLWAMKELELAAK